jgi:hypothetical protein
VVQAPLVKVTKAVMLTHPAILLVAVVEAQVVLVDLDIPV